MCRDTEADLSGTLENVALTFSSRSDRGRRGAGVHLAGGEPSCSRAQCHALLSPCCSHALCPVTRCARHPGGSAQHPRDDPRGSSAEPQRSPPPLFEMRPFPLTGGRPWSPLSVWVSAKATQAPSRGRPAGLRWDRPLRPAPPSAPGGGSGCPPSGPLAPRWGLVGSRVHTLAAAVAPGCSLRALSAL